MSTKKHPKTKYFDLPVGLCEQRGCRYEYHTRKGNPIGQIKCLLRNGKWKTATYGDTRTRKEAIKIVADAKIEDKTFTNT